METITYTIPGYRVYEYLLALAPHEEPGQRISKLKEAFAEKSGSREVRKKQAERGNCIFNLSSINSRENGRGGNGKWEVGSGKWKMGSGKWKVESE